MKKTKILLFLLFFLFLERSFSLGVVNGEIIMNIDKNCKIDVKELFHFYVANQEETAKLMKYAKENSVNLNAWLRDFKEIKLYVGQKTNIENIKLVFDEKEKKLVITYSIKGNACNLIRKTEKIEEYELKSWLFYGFVEGGLITIPKGFNFYVVLPPNGKFEKEKIKPENFEELKSAPSFFSLKEIKFKNIIVFRGFLATNEMKIIFSFEKPIIEKITISKIILNYYKKNSVVIVVFVIGFLFILIIGKRKIRKSIIDFVEKYSEIKKKES